jgi:TATA-binding protein-associated factor
MKQMLDIVENVLFKKHMPSVTYMRLDGSTDAKKRHAVVQTFNSDPSIDCLLLTTHVGGLGLTLTGADTVIFVEHDWNPMKDLQAMDRAHRIGQKKVVNVYRLITKGTLEEKIMGYAEPRFLSMRRTHFAAVYSALNSISQTLSLHNRTPAWHRWTQT